MSNKKNKKWQLRPQIDEKFIKAHTGYNFVILQLLKNRGFETKEEFDLILNPDFAKNTHDPFLFSKMEEVASLVIKHIKEKNKIFVYGDYDADGVTASSLLLEVLRVLKADVDIYIPERVSEGYGLNTSALKYIKQMNGKLVITVDTGIRSKESVSYGKQLGLELIITDHHVPPEKEEDFPDCLVLDPLMPDEQYPFKYLAGVGVSYKLACAIISKAKIDDNLKSVLCERLLDLVAVGTVADCVVLLDENRVLVKRGLEILANTKRVGLKELMRIAGVKQEKKIAAWNIGFQIAPRINAAGRMDHANTAFELMITKDEKRAKALSLELNGNNIERQNKTIEILEEVEKQIKGNEKIIIGVSKEGKKWNEGIIGLVAGRVCEKYYRPTLVITKSGDEFRGSGRSIESFNLIEAIENCGEFLERYGGHPMACGFAVKEENLENFIKKIQKIADGKLSDDDLIKKLNIESELSLNEVNEELIDEILKLEPYGEGNPQPNFLFRSLQIMDLFFMGEDGQHIKIKLKGDGAKTINALGFNQAEIWSDLNIGDKINIVCYLDVNEFNGRKEEQMRIIDIERMSD